MLVNNAGAMTKAPFLDMAFDEWRKIFTVDVDGAFLCSQIAARQMVKQGQGGRIINITSVHEHTPLPDASAYTAAKHALGGLTKAMALELVRHKILVNAVALAIATPMNGMDDSDVKPDAEPSIPLRRFGATHEIASLVVWLCSEGANYTTGQSLIVDGGFMLANPQFNQNSAVRCVDISLGNILVGMKRRTSVVSGMVPGCRMRRERLIQAMVLRLMIRLFFPRRFSHQRTPTTRTTTRINQTQCFKCWSRLCNHGAIT